MTGCHSLYFVFGVPGLSSQGDVPMTAIQIPAECSKFPIRYHLLFSKLIGSIQFDAVRVIRTIAFANGMCNGVPIMCFQTGLEFMPDAPNWPRI